MDHVPIEPCFRNITIVSTAVGVTSKCDSLAIVTFNPNDKNRRNRGKCVFDWIDLIFFTEMNENKDE